MMHRMKYRIALLLVLTSAAAMGQSQRQLAERGVKRTEVRTVDARKDERSVRVVTTTYDRRGNELETLELDSLGRVMNWERHMYDRKGRELVSAVLDSTGTEAERTFIERDRWGNQVTITVTERGSLTERTIITYDAYGNREEERVTDATGRRVRRTTFEYEPRGLLKRRVVYDAQDRIVLDRSYEYTY